MWFHDTSMKNSDKIDILLVFSMCGVQFELSILDIYSMCVILLFLSQQAMVIKLFFEN